MSGDVQPPCATGGGRAAGAAGVDNGPQMDLLKTLTAAVTELQGTTATLDKALGHHHANGDPNAYRHFHPNTDCDQYVYANPHVKRNGNVSNARATHRRSGFAPHSVPFGCATTYPNCHHTTNFDYPAPTGSDTACFNGGSLGRLDTLRNR